LWCPCLLLMLDHWCLSHARRTITAENYLTAFVGYASSVFLKQTPKMFNYEADYVAAKSRQLGLLQRGGPEGWRPCAEDGKDGYAGRQDGKKECGPKGDESLRRRGTGLPHLRITPPNYHLISKFRGRDLCVKLVPCNHHCPVTCRV
jgi:hypothetical protein